MQKITDQNWGPSTLSPSSNRGLFSPEGHVGRGVRPTSSFDNSSWHDSPSPQRKFYFTLSVINKFRPAVIAKIMEIISFTEKTENILIHLLFIFLFAVAFKSSVPYPKSYITLVLRPKQHQYLLRTPVTVSRRIS